DINSPTGEYNVYIDQTLTYSNLSYNPYTPVQAGYYKLELTDDTTQYVEFTLLTQAQAICYGADLTEGTQDDIGYYHDNGCWILGAENQNCTNACTTATLTCGAGDWNDDTSCAICSELTGVGVCSADTNQFSPSIYNEIACRHRDIPLPMDYCNVTSDPDYQRICKCE
ncbi:hypothetical protein KJ742_01705, partial [Patescibacteria group bacterium]|nr:hypothetical protein [Patescibacteria group bacterium]